MSEQAELPFGAYAPFAVIPTSMWDLMRGTCRGVIRCVGYLGTLCRRPGEWVKISHRRMAQITGYAVDTVRRYLARAERAGLIRRRSRYGDDGEQRCNEYQLVMVARAPAKDGPKPSPLRAAILHAADVFVAAWNSHNEDAPLENAAQALASSASLYVGANARGDDVYVTCTQHVVAAIRAIAQFAGMRERAIMREIGRIASG